jgi:hypothetical protein
MPAELKHKINSSLCKSKFEGSREFLPRDRLLELSNEATVRDELAWALSDRLGEDELQDLLRYVLAKARSVFLTLVHVDLVENIYALSKEGFDDDCLPIILRPAQEHCRASGITERPNVKGTRTKKPRAKQFIWSVRSWDNERARRTGKVRPSWEAFLDRDAWDSIYLELFAEKQWLFLAPVFSRRSTLEYEFHEKVPLPFIRKNLSLERTGYFSVVSQYEIHPAHFENTEQHSVCNQLFSLTFIWRPTCSE